MHFFTTVLHVVLCITLILIILLQPGKDAGSVLGGGGGGNQMYGPRGQGHFLGKVTTVIAATFMFTSITLAFYSRPSEEASTETLAAIREIEQAGELPVESQDERDHIEGLQEAIQIDLEENNSFEGPSNQDGDVTVEGAQDESEASPSMPEQEEGDGLRVEEVDEGNGDD